IRFPLQNILPIDTVNLIATMLPSGQVTPITGSQGYGVVPGLGAPISRTFSFQANMAPGMSCGDTFQVTFQLMDQTNDLGQISVPFRFGVPRTTLIEDFQEVLSGPLPLDWASSASGGGVPWYVATNPPPNDPFGGSGLVATYQGTPPP